MALIPTKNAGAGNGVDGLMCDSNRCSAGEYESIHGCSSAKVWTLNP
jgi:hypothetical protein